MRAWWLWEWLCKGVLRAADSSGGWCQAGAQTLLRAMSAEQLAAFWAAVKADASLQETLKGAADLDAAVAVAKEAGFDVSKADLLEYQAQREGQLSDEDLEKVAGGFVPFGVIDPMGMMDGPSAMPKK